jgi:hypothetical protein
MYTYCDIFLLNFFFVFYNIIFIFYKIKDPVDLNNNSESVKEPEPRLKYKQLFSNNSPSSRDQFKRVLLSKNHIFVLANGESVHKKNSVFIIDTQKLESGVKA